MFVVAQTTLLFLDTISGSSWGRSHALAKVEDYIAGLSGSNVRVLTTGIGGGRDVKTYASAWGPLDLYRSEPGRQDLGRSLGLATPAIEPTGLQDLGISLGPLNH